MFWRIILGIYSQVVPQGSILGPILSLLYINDLPLNIMGTKIVLFADDTNILVSDVNINNLQDKLNNVMTELQTWFTLNNLVVNTEKTLAMSFHTTQKKKHCYHTLHLRVETFHTILKQNFWAYTLMKI
jgi:hypothetical protein